MIPIILRKINVGTT